MASVEITRTPISLPWTDRLTLRAAQGLSEFVAWRIERRRTRLTRALARARAEDLARAASDACVQRAYGRDIQR